MLPVHRYTKIHSLGTYAHQFTIESYYIKLVCYTSEFLWSLWGFILVSWHFQSRSTTYCHDSVI